MPFNVNINVGSIGSFCKCGGKKSNNDNPVDKPITIMKNTDITLLPTEYIDYENFFDNAIGICLIDIEFKCKFVSGSILKNIFPEVNINVIDFWKNDFDFFVRMLNNLKESKKVQLVIEYLDNKYRLCGNYAENKEGKIDSYMIVAKIEKQDATSLMAIV